MGITGGGAWGHNVTCPYPVYYEMDLLPGQFGRDESIHFNRASASLEQALGRDPALLNSLSAASGKSGSSILARVARTNKRRNPEGFTWHHATREQADGREGVMQLTLDVK